MEAVLQSEGVDAAAALGLHKVTDDLYTAGQLDEEQFRKAHALGIKTILNVRAPGEEGYAEFPELAKQLGLQYDVMPIKEELLGHEYFDQLTVYLDKCERPALVHCRSGKRATALALAHKATREGSAREVDATHGQHISHIKEDFLITFVRTYLAAKLDLTDSLPQVQKLNDGLLISPQFSEEQLRKVKEEHGIKSVLNLRSMEEAGQVGFGVLPREKQLVESLGLVYENIPTKAKETPTSEQMDQIQEALHRLPRPILVHCRTMKRSLSVAAALNLKDQ